jgi:predicted heme/steroid binding protein
MVLAVDAIMAHQVLLSIWIVGREVMRGYPRSFSGIIRSCGPYFAVVDGVVFDVSLYVVWVVGRMVVTFEASEAIEEELLVERPVISVEPG